jgi:hypothetical protein
MKNMTRTRAVAKEFSKLSQIVRKKFKTYRKCFKNYRKIFLFLTLEETSMWEVLIENKPRNFAIYRNPFAIYRKAKHIAMR